MQTVNSHHYQSNTDTFNDENSVVTAALGQLLSTTSQNPTINSKDEIRLTGNENTVSIVSAPKNVKFIIPLSRSGITSNESTFSVIESTTRKITHVKDIFPLNPLSQSQIDTVTLTSSSNSEQIDPENQQDEEIPLLSKENK